MFARLFLLFLFVPLIELALLIWIGQRLGLLATLGLVVLTGAIGAMLARSQGISTFRSIQRDVAAGRTPAPHLLDGLLILIGGVLLLTPGLISDLTGILLLLPPTRSRLKAIVRRRIERMIQNGQVNIISILP